MNTSLATTDKIMNRTEQLEKWVVRANGALKICDAKDDQIKEALAYVFTLIGLPAGSIPMGEVLLGVTSHRKR